MAAEATVQEVIDQAWELAMGSAEGAQNYSAQAVAESKTNIIYAPVHKPTMPTKPEMLPLPDFDWYSLFDNDFDTFLNNLKALLDNQLEAFLDKYFPDYATKLKTISDWIDSAVANGGTGIPAAVEQALWDRARDREAAEALATEQDATAFWAARGYELPTGALADQILKAQIATLQQNNSLSREVAIKQAELEQANIQFAVDQGVKLHIGVLKAGDDYLAALMGAVGAAINKSAALVDAIRAMYAAITEYNRGLIEAEKLILAYDEIYIDSDKAELGADVTTFGNKINARVDAAVAAARAMGDLAASAVNSQSTIATISHSTIA